MLLFPCACLVFVLCRFSWEIISTWGRIALQKGDPLIIFSDPVSSGIMVTPRTCVPGCPSSTPSSLSRPDHGRIHLWMGSDLRSSDSKGCVVERSVFSPYKLSRAGDCFPRLEEIPELAVWRTCPFSDTQHYGDALSEQGGGPGPGAWTGRSERLFISGWAWRLHFQQYISQGRLPLSVSNRESSLIGVLHRMVSQPQGGQHTLRYLGTTYSRSVHHSPEQQGRCVLFMPPRPSSLAGQFSAGGLVQGCNVHVSPSATPSPCSSQGDQGGGSGHCNSTVVATKRVVTPSPAARSGPASDVARVQWSSTRPRRGRVPRPQGTPPRCLETLGSYLRSRGVSREAASHRPSTRALYHAKLQPFCHWCSRREKDPLHPSIRTVLSYLQHLQRRDLTHSTILSHVSTLSSCTNKVDGVLVGRHPLVARCVLGDRKGSNPPRRSLVPRWNLLVVLAALIEKPFEPLCQAKPRDLTLKVLFLLAATLARRVSEIQPLFTNSSFLIQNPQSFHLAPNPAFLQALSWDLKITAFYPEPTNTLERVFHLMCPTRALHIYLRCTEHSHRPNRSLFVHWDEGRTHHPVLKRWISPVLQTLFVPLIAIKAGRMRLSVLTHTRYRAWRPPWLR